MPDKIDIAQALLSAYLAGPDDAGLSEFQFEKARAEALARIAKASPASEASPHASSTTRPIAVEPVGEEDKIAGASPRERGEPAKVIEFVGATFDGKFLFTPFEPDPDLEMAAHADELPEYIDFIPERLPTFLAVARCSARRPHDATTLTVSRPVEIAGEPAPPKVVVTWPEEQRKRREEQEFQVSFGSWVAEIEVEVRWKQFIALLHQEQVQVVLAGG